MLSILVALCLVSRQIPFRLPSRRLAHEALRNGWSLFCCAVPRASTRSAMLSFWIFRGSHGGGLFRRTREDNASPGRPVQPDPADFIPSPHQTDAHFTGAGSAAGPRRNEHHRPGRIGAGLAVFLLAPWLVRIVLGTQFAPAVAVLRLLSLLPPWFRSRNPLGCNGSCPWEENGWSRARSCWRIAARAPGAPAGSEIRARWHGLRGPLLGDLRLRDAALPGRGDSNHRLSFRRSVAVPDAARRASARPRRLVAEGLRWAP